MNKKIEVAPCALKQFPLYVFSVWPFELCFPAGTETLSELPVDVCPQNAGDPAWVKFCCQWGLALLWHWVRAPLQLCKSRVTTLAPGLILDIAEFPAARHTLASCWQLWYEQGELPGRMGCVCFLSAPLWFHSLPRQPKADLMLAGGNTQMCHFFYSIHAKNVFLKKRPVDIERFVGVQKQQEFFISVCRAALRWQIEMEAIHLFSRTDA